MQRQELLRSLPAVDEILQVQEIKEGIRSHGRTLMVETIREAIQTLRNQILAGQACEPGSYKDYVVRHTLEMVKEKFKFNFRPVINATGIVLHTNLGRAVLSPLAQEALHQSARGYSNLELDLTTGQRGSRYSHVSELLKKLTGCEDAMVVNNNAAAVLLALNTLAQGKEVIVSRGQLVEIGGSFRVPEVMEASGAKLVEVGTTNKTYLRDYERVITEETAALLKVHTSNYRVVGFTHETSTEELVALARAKNLPLMVDLGSGSLIDLGKYNIYGEPTVQALIAQGVDVVTFSGDKLLGGPQAGIIVGKGQYISLMKKNPLTRALRVDKLTLAALEGTLREYLEPEKVVEVNPTLRMLTIPGEILRQEAEKLQEALQRELAEVEVKVEPGYSQAGGGSLPTTDIPTYLVTLKPLKISEERLAESLRLGEPAVLVRMGQGKILLDVRTILPGQQEQLIAACKRAVIKVQEG